MLTLKCPTKTNVIFNKNKMQINLNKHINVL